MRVNKTLFIYYKVDSRQHATWVQRVRDFQGQLQVRHPLIEIELMQRPASNDGLETWMEIYRHPDGISDLLTQAIQALALEMGLPSKRASEVFVPLI
jgi:sporulation-control protein spo0M